MMANRQEKDANEEALRASEERKKMLEKAAEEVGASGEEREEEETISTKERAERDSHILERARMLADEALPEVIIKHKK